MNPAALVLALAISAGCLTACGGTSSTTGVGTVTGSLKMQTELPSPTPLSGLVWFTLQDKRTGASTVKAVRVGESGKFDLTLQPGRWDVRGSSLRNGGSRCGLRPAVAAALVHVPQHIYVTAGSQSRVFVYCWNPLDRTG